MSTTSTAAAHRPGRRTTHQMLNKVPEVTLWFWVIKILCTTVGESFADYVNVDLGVGLVPTAVLFSIALVVVLGAQMSLRRYVPAVYWLTVVVVSVAGTLYTDILTDQVGVPLLYSTTVFTALLLAVFGTWWVRERTLSIHSIVTTPRESFYWLTVLVTFALGTATGDWTLELTGWGPGTSVLLPLSLIAVVAALWRYGAQPVLAFWLAYVLTRPLGANVGDWLATPTSEKGLGLGTFGTSVAFLLAILVTVAYLTASRADVIERDDVSPSRPRDPRRERHALVGFGVAALATVALLAYADSQPHQSSLDDEGAAPACSAGAVSGAEARQRVADRFPSSDVSRFRTIAQDTLALAEAGDNAGATAGATDLETAWDDAEANLSAIDCSTWTYVDGQVDDVLSAVRTDSPDRAAETAAVDALVATLG